MDTANGMTAIKYKYLDKEGLHLLWNKISNTYLRNSNIVNALTKVYPEEGAILTDENDVFIQKRTFDELGGSVEDLQTRIQKVENAQGLQDTNIDGDTIVNKNGIFQTDIILENDKNLHRLFLRTRGGTTVSMLDYTDFYQEVVKDNFLKTVELVTLSNQELGYEAGTYLKFIFNDESNKQPIYVNVTDLIDIYTGSDYISVEKNGDKTSISLKTTEFVDYLVGNDVFGIDSIITRLGLVEDDLIDIKNQIENIYVTLEDVPTAPITIEEINALTES